MSPTEFVKYAAKFVTALAAALAIAGVALADNSISPSEWVQIILAFLGAVGVYAIPNTSKENI